MTQRASLSPPIALVLSETGSDHLHVIAEEVSRVAELCIGQGNPTRFFVVSKVGGGVAFAIKTGASDLEATAAYCWCQGKVGGTHSKGRLFKPQFCPPEINKLRQVNMSSNPRLDAALMVLRNAGQRIGDVHIPPHRKHWQCASGLTVFLALLRMS